jgi:hypothetical protein
MEILADRGRDPDGHTLDVIETASRLRIVETTAV